MTLTCQFHNCGAPLTYGGKGQPPKYCAACKPGYLRELSSKLYHKRVVELIKVGFGDLARAQGRGCYFSGT